MPSNDNEKISKLNEKIKQLQAQKNALLAREKEKERKARTRRLIQIGAIFDSFGFDSIEKANEFKEQLNKNDFLGFKLWYEKFTKENKENA